MSEIGYIPTTYELQFPRGDTFAVNVEILKNGTAITDFVNNVVTFTMKRKYTYRDARISKRLENKVLYILPDETKALPFGKYDFDIQVITQEGETRTPIIGTIDLTEESTWH